ncbi:MAG: shikimate dehydrogenase [Alcaligenaceae bacterium]|nr:shikimate dehydrogenase [Alcaligenaceae bacterium]
MTDRYAVIGNPIAQSKSPLLHMAFARQFGHDIRYDPLLATHETFRDTVTRFMDEGGLGMNVTAPFKLDALRMADRLSPRAHDAQAVNTLKFEQDGIYGDNTDGIGLVTDIRERLGIELAGKRVLIVGAGGAARGIFLPLIESRPSYLLLVNRTADKAHAILGDRAQAGVLEAGPIAQAEGGAFDVVIHATFAGLTGGEVLMPEGIFAPGALAYDLSYDDQDTPFITDARRAGASQLSDGLGMLVAQGAESYQIWRGVRPEMLSVLNMLRPQ